jgi:hypothetical protein
LAAAGIHRLDRSKLAYFYKYQFYIERTKIHAFSVSTFHYLCEVGGAVDLVHGNNYGEPFVSGNIHSPICPRTLDLWLTPAVSSGLESELDMRKIPLC